MYCKIESSSNEFYKHLKKLQTKKERDKTLRYIAEGIRAVADAIKNKADIYAVVVSEGYRPDINLDGLKVYELSQKLFDEVKQTVNSQGIIAVINYNIKTVADADFSKFSTILYLDSVTDPGNMGTIIRSADALGADAIILSRGCVDIFNPKVVRSTMASLLNVPVYTDSNPEQTFKNLREFGFDIAGTFPKASDLSCDYEYFDKTVLVMGNEANGISPLVEGMCTARITIPMLGNAESLNVATACTVMLYEIMTKKFKKENRK